ncbi:FAD-dependent monooxygenase [Nesterenkonia sp. CL21]|uniref:FAD-dependent monooxygenase n=1 Tax=Nesterenkonia sp. CL21 TaxID=3064894 RepID=UPI002879C26C|nr:FAD-dependent monooxygenase [Nesterenkonia sp. CL21]MDS2173438.1 FAD-dependent monooxygenase [Nesterenkonia sp. CL21]
MSAVAIVAIVGAGVTGLAAARGLAQAGVRVEVFESASEISAKGSGITLQGNALRALRGLGLWEEVRDSGYPFEGLRLRAPGPDAAVVAELPDVKTGGDDLPAAMGMPRRELARIMYQGALNAGAQVEMGARVTHIDDRGTEIGLFVDGQDRGPYDLIIGADGLNSTIRDGLGIGERPEPTGMGIWRTFVSRPDEVTETQLFYGGPAYIAGYTPTGDDSMYAFLVEAAQDRTGVDDAEAVRIMDDLSASYGGPWESIRRDLRQGAAVNYTWFTSHLVPAPWNRGRAVIIGDAAHSCPPTIAQGAAQGLEDAAVLTELLLSSDRLDDDLWSAFHARRVPRASAVVDASVQLGQWQLDGDREADAPGLIVATAKQMAVPA